MVEPATLLRDPVRVLWGWLSSADAPPIPRFVCTGLCLLFGIAAALAGGAWRFAFVVCAFVAGGTRTARSASAGLLRGRPDINFLMIFAGVVAALVGHWEDGLILLFLFSLSDALERFAIEKTRRSVSGLIQLRPATACVVRDGREWTAPVDELRVGDEVRVRPGERLPVDGEVTDGGGAVDESILTGEAMPVEKLRGDHVFTGTFNVNGSLLVRMTRPATDTTLARIVHLVEEAQERKAPFQRMIDRWEMPYVYAVLGACALLILWRLGATGDVARSVYAGMVLLVAASPCAVVLASPVAVLAAISRGAQGGVLFKGGSHLERLAITTRIAFDKTGTLTRGRPLVDQILPAEGSSADALLQVAAAVEQYSEHPLARAIVAEAQRRALVLPEAADFRSEVGMGVLAVVDSRRVRISRPEALPSFSSARAAGLLALLRQAPSQTAVVLEQEAGVAGVITFRDELRPEAREALAALRGLGLREFVMLTGDHVGPARRVADELAIEAVHAGLLPAEKVRHVHRLAKDDGGAVMVGDGVNDAPALAAATVGVAMGSAGSDVALETADVVLMRDDLRLVPEAVHLARACRRAIQQGLAMALGTIAVLIALAFAGIPLPMAVIGHEGSTVAVILRGMQLLRLPKITGTIAPPALAAAARR